MNFFKPPRNKIRKPIMLNEDDYEINADYWEQNDKCWLNEGFIFDGDQSITSPRHIGHELSINYE